LIITFCGHAHIVNRMELQNAVLSTILEYAQGDVTFYLGGYGDFDAVALAACKKFKERHPAARLVFVTPYLNESYLKKREFYLQNYNDTIFPPIESVSPKYPF